MRIPPELRRFILASVPSIPFLEATLLLRRDPDVAWSAPQLASALYVGTGPAEQLLHELEAAGIARPVDAERSRWHFAPADEALASAYAELDGLYRVQTVAVTQLIHDATQRSAQHFADAFKLRKDP